jgi:CubicO group peptidase (beta-lactamase class C family)
MDERTQRIGAATRDDVQTLLDDAVGRAGAAGAQLSLALGGEQMDFASGFANANRGEVMMVDTIGMIGSITKLFNAAMVVSLADAGHVSLDKEISAYVPGLALADGAESVVTLRQLLSMSAGLDNGPYNVRGAGEDSLSDYVHSLADVALLYPPGQGFGYSNAGCCLAGYVAQRVMNERWDRLVRERVIGPCGIDEFALGADELPFHRVSVGHEASKTSAPHPVIRPWGHSQAQAPSGSSLAMSARGLARFGRILAGGGCIGGRQALSATTVGSMTEPTAAVPGPIPSFGVGDAWGLGPSRSQWSGHTTWSHSGGVRSARSLLSWFPSFQGVVALTVNTPDAFSALTTYVMRALGTAAFGLSAPSTPTTSADPFQISQLDRYVGTYVRFGTRYDLDAQGGKLRYLETNLGVGYPGESFGVVVDCECAPVATDRFSIAVPGFEQPLPLSFGGQDNLGRATNLVSTLLCARRMDVDTMSRRLGNSVSFSARS